MRQGSRPSGIVRWAAALGATLILAAGSASAATPATTSPPASDPQPAPTATITLAALRPQVARPGETVTVTGVVRTTEKLTAATVRVYVRRNVSVRAQLVNAVVNNVPEGTPTARVALPATLAAGARTRFTVVIPAELLAGGSDVGVRILRIELRADAPGGGTRRVAVSTTFVPWAPATEVPQASELALVWPFTDSPHRGADQVFADDSLAARLHPGGRLRTLLTASAGWTLAVDPMLVEDVAAMAAPSGYSVAGAGRRPQDPDAVLVLQTLRARAAAGAVTLLPYADVDVAALVAARRESEIAAALTAAHEVAQRLLLRDLRVRVALPQADGPTAATVAALDRAGVHVAVLPGSWVPPDPLARFTPSARTAVVLGDGVSAQAVLTDPILGGLATAPADRPAALARLLAETAMHTAELPGTPRSLAIVLPAAWDPVGAQSLVTALRAAPWIRPVALDALATRAGSDTRAAVLATRPAPLLSRSYLQQVGDHAQAGVDFSRVLARNRDATALARSYASERLRLESVAAPGTGPAVLSRSARGLAARAGLIKIVTNGHVTIPGSQSFPLTIRNESDSDVRVAVSFTRSGRVSVDSTKVVRVKARSPLRLSVRARASANGTADITTQLMTPRGRLIGRPQTLRVTVRSAGGPAKVVVGLAGVVFVLALAARVLRRRTPVVTPEPAPERVSVP